ncbi:hypothetical protein BH23ACT9_BH23ACT9_34980 [soil metagenome]
MKNLQIRNVPDEIHRRLKARAAMEGRSLSEMALAELMRALERPTLAELAARVRQHEPVHTELTMAELVRAERDGR